MVNIMQNIYLVSCSKLKRGALSKAEDLYISENFNIAKELAKKYSDNWHIVSGKHGLVSPGENLEPYDFSLAEMTVVERMGWAKKIRNSIIEKYSETLE